MALGLPPALRERSSAICVICDICGLLVVSSRLTETLVGHDLH
jgi:hypothetical protein